MAIVCLGKHHTASELISNIMAIVIYMLYHSIFSSCVMHTSWNHGMNRVAGEAQRVRAAEEASIAGAAAEGSETTRYQPGKNEKTSRHVDVWKCGTDDSFGLVAKSGCETHGRCYGKRCRFCESLGRHVCICESASRKRHRNYQEVTGIIRYLVGERKAHLHAGSHNVIMNKELGRLEKERELLSCAQDSGRNLQGGLNFDN